MMKQIQYCAFHASFLVPVYNLPQGELSRYIATQQGRNNIGDIFIDVWMVRANPQNPRESALQSLRQEEQNYAKEIEKTPINDAKIAKLKHGQQVFSELVQMANTPVYNKKPDEAFLNIAKRNFANPSLKQYGPDLKNYIYLSAISNYHEK